MHPSVSNVLKMLEPDPEDIPLQEEYYNLAQKVADHSPNSAETTIALRKLLESRDSALRAK